MDANSYTQAQLDTIVGLTASSNGTPIGFSMIRFGSSDIPTNAYIAGVTLRGSDQQTIQNYDSRTGITAQPAPYGGVGIVGTGNGIVQNVRL